MRPYMCHIFVFIAFVVLITEVQSNKWPRSEKRKRSRRRWKRHYHKGETRDVKPTFDYLKLTMSWKPSAALVYADSDFIRDEIDEVWTIHGLWPQALDAENQRAMKSIRPVYERMIEKERRQAKEDERKRTSEEQSDEQTDDSQKMAAKKSRDSKETALTFREKVIRRKLNKMIKKVKTCEDIETIWSTVFRDRPPESLWEREWYLHGRFCRSQVPRLSKPLNYFKKAIQLARLLTISEWLSEEPAIVPQNAEMDITPLVSRVKNRFGFKVEVGIMMLFQKEILTELRFCYNTKLEPQNCPGVEELPKNKMALFPRADSRFFPVYWLQFHWYTVFAKVRTPGFDFWTNFGLRLSPDHLRLGHMKKRFSIDPNTERDALEKYIDEWNVDVPMDDEKKRKKVVPSSINLADFWNHQGHVFIALRIANIKSADDYFRKSIEMAKKLGPLKMLQDVPKDVEIERNEIQTRIKGPVTTEKQNVWDYQVMLLCKTASQENSKKYLYAIGFCFDMQDRETNCPPEISTCATEESPTFTLASVHP